MVQKRTCVKTKKVASPATGHRVERCAQYSPTKALKRASPKKASPKRSPKRAASPKRRSPNKSPRKLTKWNRFVRANAGKGYSPAQLAAMYAKQK